MDQHKIVIYAIQDMYILHCKQGHHMPINLHLIPYILVVYLGHM